MTREEARRILFVTRVLAMSSDEDRLDLTFDEIDALEVAIEALKQPEIIRCEDCEFREGSCCAYSAVYLWADGFCHRGRKRKE